MPSITFIENLVATACRDAEHTALDLAINAVDTLLEHSVDLDDFKDKWGTAKALYREHTP